MAPQDPSSRLSKILDSSAPDGHSASAPYSISPADLVRAAEGTHGHTGNTEADQAPAAGGGHGPEFAGNQVPGLLIDQAPAAERARGRRRFSEAAPAHASRRARGEFARVHSEIPASDVEKLFTMEPPGNSAPSSTADKTSMGENIDGQNIGVALTGEQGHILDGSSLEQTTVEPGGTHSAPSQVLEIVGVPDQHTLPHQRRNRWDQPPPLRCFNCPTGQATMIMTCCRVLLCRDCAAVNPCGCPEWQERRGFAVPILPAYPIPYNCILENPITLTLDGYAFMQHGLENMCDFASSV